MLSGDVDAMMSCCQCCHGAVLYCVCSVVLDVNDQVKSSIARIFHVAGGGGGGGADNPGGAGGGVADV